MSDLKRSRIFYSDERSHFSRHMQVLLNAGLITRKEFDEIKSFQELCKNKESNGKILDVITQEELKDYEIVKLSDNNCYSKYKMQTFVRKGTVDTKTGRPVLPLSQQPMQDSDYKILEMAVPTHMEMQRAIREQDQINAEQLTFGNVEAWKNGQRPATIHLALYLSDPDDRKRLALELGINETDLPQSTLRPTTQNISKVINVDLPNIVKSQQNATILQKNVVDLVSRLPIRKIPLSISNLSSAAIYQDGSVICSITSFTGEKTEITIKGVEFYAVSVIGEHFYGILSNGILLQWTASSPIVQIGEKLTRTGAKFVQICAHYEPIALLDSGKIIYFGSNSNLLNLDQNAIKIAVSSSDAMAITDDGKIVDLYAKNLLKAAEGQSMAPDKKFVNISLAQNHAAGLLNDLSLIEWGGIQKKTKKRFLAVSVGFNYSIALTEDQSLVGWGVNGEIHAEKGQSLLQNQQKIVFIDASSQEHSAAICQDGSMIQWGNLNSLFLKKNSNDKFMIPTL